MSALSSRLDRFVRNPLLIMAVGVFVLVQSAAILAHAAPTIHDGDNCHKVEMSHDGSGGHKQNTDPDDGANPHSALPNTGSAEQACDNLCCLSGCQNAFVTSGYVAAMSSTGHAYTLSIDRHNRDRLPAPPDYPPKP